MLREAELDWCRKRNLTQVLSFVRQGWGVGDWGWEVVPSLGFTITQATSKVSTRAN